MRSSARRTLERWDKRYLWHPFTQQAEWEALEPLIVTRARGVRIWDARGRSFIDGVSSLWVTLHGHREPSLDRAVRRQLERVAHSTFLGLTHEPAIRLGRALARIAPRGLSRVFYSDNGATAVEVALKMAFQFWAQRGEPRRTEYLALEGSYHGDTLGAVSVGGIAVFQKKFRPLLFRAHFALAPHCYRCPHRRRPAVPVLRTGEEPVPARAPRPGEARPETGCRWECLASAEEILKRRAPRLAAAIIEPVVQGAAGMRVMPRGYLKGLERLCRRRNVLLIADEVATGFGRTGRLFAVQNEGVKPDFLCLAKSLTGGYLPLAVTLTTKKIYRVFLGRTEDLRTFFHGHSYTANPLACAVALENLALLERRRLIKGTMTLRRRLKRFLEAVAGHPWVGHARQAGLMAGVELVQDKQAGRPFPPAARVAQRVCREALDRGLWIRPLGDVIVLLPPLGISPAEFDRMLAIVMTSLQRVSGGASTAPGNFVKLPAL